LDDAAALLFDIVNDMVFSSVSYEFLINLLVDQSAQWVRGDGFPEIWW
jgi:hypothetical protein